MHLLGADLHLEGQAVRADDRGVEGLISVGLWSADIVLEAAQNGLVEKMCIRDSLQEVPADGAVGLLPVPGAAPGSPQQPHDLQKILVAVKILTLKLYHKMPAFARKIHGKPLIFQGILADRPLGKGARPPGFSF